MDEYARSRFILFCTSAATFPIVIDNAATIQISQTRPGAWASNSILSSTANTAALGAVDMNPTIGAGAPSYTSGVQMWKGAAATLNPKPTNIIAIPTKASSGTLVAARLSLITAMLVDPVAPNINATP